MENNDSNNNNNSNDYYNNKECFQKKTIIKKANVIITLIKLNFKYNVIKTINLKYMNKALYLKLITGNIITLNFNIYENKNILNEEEIKTISTKFTNNIIEIIKENKKLNKKYIIINKNNINNIDVYKCLNENINIENNNENNNNNDNDKINKKKETKRIKKENKESLFSNFLSYLLIQRGIELKLNISNIKININSIKFFLWDSFIINNEENNINELIKESIKFIEYIYNNKKGTSIEISNEFIKNII